MKDFFKPEDFQFGHYPSNRDAAQLANEKLNKEIQSWPLVYLNDFRSVHADIRFISREVTNSHTHQARLAFIEEIAKEPCKHEPDMPLVFHTSNGMVPAFEVHEYIKPNKKCKHCLDKLDNEALKMAVEALEDSCEGLQFRMEKNQEVTPSGYSGKHDKIISAGFGILLRVREALTKIRELRGKK